MGLYFLRILTCRELNSIELLYSLHLPNNWTKPDWKIENKSMEGFEKDDEYR